MQGLVLISDGQSENFALDQMPWKDQIKEIVSYIRIFELPSNISTVMQGIFIDVGFVNEI